MLSEAAATIVRAVAAVRPQASAVVLVHRGADVLWDTTARLLRKDGREVLAHQLDERDGGWCLPTTLGDKRLRIGGRTSTTDVLVYHDPFVTDGKVGDLSTLRALVGNGTAAVFISFPHNVSPALRDRLRPLFLRALAAGERELRSRARRISAAISKMASLTVCGPNGAQLRVDPPLRVRTDWTSAALDVPVIQLPYGEVWIACEPSCVTGSVTFALGERTAAATVDQGRLHWRETGLRPVSEPLVEVGIGTNLHAPWLPQTVLHEKACNAIHIGFGDNTLIGGRHYAPVHFDLPLETGSSIADLDIVTDSHAEEPPDAITSDVHDR